jgi:hypothetical protein
LFTAQISLRCKYGNRAKEELDLFQFSAIHVAELRARAAEIMRGEMVHLHPFGTPSDDIPDDILGNSFSP